MLPFQYLSNESINTAQVPFAFFNYFKGPETQKECIAAFIFLATEDDMVCMVKPAQKVVLITGDSMSQVRDFIGNFVSSRLLFI